MSFFSFVLIKRVTAWFKYELRVVKLDNILFKQLHTLLILMRQCLYLYFTYTPSTHPSYLWQHIFPWFSSWQLKKNPKLGRFSQPNKHQCLLHTAVALILPPTIFGLFTKIGLLAHNYALSLLFGCHPQVNRINCTIYLHHSCRRINTEQRNNISKCIHQKQKWKSIEWSLKIRFHRIVDEILLH